MAPDICMRDLNFILYEELNSGVRKCGISEISEITGFGSHNTFKWSGGGQVDKIDRSQPRRTILHPSEVSCQSAARRRILKQSTVYRIGGLPGNLIFRLLCIYVFNLSKCEV